MALKEKNRVFRIRQWRYDYNMRSWKKIAKLSFLCDNEKDYLKKMTQLCRIYDHRNRDTNISFGLVGEELIDGDWAVISYHPENFDYEKIS